VNKKRVAVIGAGIVGACVARYLQRDGHDVVLIDPLTPGEGASSGNAGCFNPSSLVPIAGPDTFRQIPKYLMDPLGPLSIRWSYLPQLSPWLIRYGLAGTPEKIRRQAQALKSLISPCFDALLPLVEDAGARDLVRRDGILIVYRSKEGVAADARAWALRRENGVDWEEFDHEQLRAFDPNLALDVKFGKYVPHNGHTINPEGLVKAIVDAILKTGGRLIKAEALGFAFDGDKLVAIETMGGRIEADTAVLAAGAHSKPLAVLAGDKIPLETERGYHVMIRNPAIQPRVPTTDSENKFVATPMQFGVRLAGTVELAGLKAAPNWKRSEILVKRIGSLFPALGRNYTMNEMSYWMGHRPSLPDSLPVMGRSKRSADIIYAFGHQHVGMTAAPYTGVVIADLISGRPSPIDLKPFRADRF
jgi:D-amino-acid dehydrogenase